MPIRQQLFSPGNAFIQGQQARQQYDAGQTRNALANMELEQAPKEIEYRNALRERETKKFTDQDRLANTEWMVGASQQVLALPQDQQQRAAAMMFEEGKRRGIVQPDAQMPTFDPQGLQQFVDDAKVQLGRGSIESQKVGGMNVLTQGGKYLSASAQPTKLETIEGPSGSILQRDPTSNKLTSVMGREPVGTTVNVNSKQETEEAKAVGKALGQQYAAIQKSGMDANAKVNRYNRMTQLLDGVRTGKLTPKITEVAALADSLGIKIDPNIGEKQALQALSNEIALQLRNPSGGAGMPGALSDKDLAFLVSMTPGLANTTEGNKLIIQSAVKLSKRDQEVAKMAREFRAKNGTLEGFSEELSQWSENNPLFESENAVAGAAGTADFIYVPGKGLQPSR